MPCYDLKCDSCGREEIDVLESVSTPQHLCDVLTIVDDIITRCAGHMVRTWITKFPSVIGDACDVWIKNGLCHEDGSPQHFTSKAEIRLEAKRRGLVNRVEHQGSASGDKSKFTSRWI